MEHYFPGPYFAAFFWGLAVLFGLVGLGRLLALAIGGEAAAQAGWGLQAVWGMAVYLFLGSMLAVFHACDALRITMLIGAGLAAWLWTTVRGGRPTWAGLTGLPWHLWPALVLVAFSFAAGVHWQFGVNWWDDSAYYNFCEKLLASGSFDDPFSWRRLASLGGQTLLLSSTMAQTSLADAMMFEIGLSPVIFFGLIAGFRGGALVRTRLGAFLAFLAATASVVRINSASEYTGVVLFMGLFVTLDHLERAEPRRRWLLAVGLVAAAFCSLRAQYIAAAGATLALYWLGWWCRDRPAVRQVLADGLWCAGALLVALLPWMIMSERSNQSPLFPLFPGGHSRAFNPVSADGSVHAKLRLVVTMFLHPWLLPSLLCLLALPLWKKALAAQAVVWAAIGTSVVLAYHLGLVPDDSTIPRYVQPLFIVAAFATLVVAARTPGRSTQVWVLAAISLALTLDRRGEELSLRYDELGANQATAAAWGPSMIAHYRKAQLLVPEGRRVLICADYPFLFDHLRNDLWNIDQPHAASPPPGLPFGKSPEETKRYLRQLGIEYVVYLDFGASRGTYHREVWRNRLTVEVPLLRIQAPFYLDFFQTIDALAGSEIVLGKEGPLTALQLKP